MRVRTVWLVGGVALCGALFALSAPEVATAAVISIPGNVTINGSGNSVTVNVNVDSADGIEAADIQIVFDPAVVEVVSDAQVTNLSVTCMPQSGYSPGALNVALACPQPLSGGPGALLTFSLRAVGPGSSTLDIVRCDLNEDPTACTPTDGAVTVVPPTPSPTITRTATRTATRTRTPTRTATGTASLTPTRTPAIGVPSITAPTNGQEIGVEGVTFAWTAVGGATGYDLRILNAVTQATIFSGTLSGGGSTSTLIGLPNNGSYTFRVRACVGAISDATCGAFASRNFIVNLITPIPVPTITLPAPGANLTSSQQTVRWTAVAGNPLLPDLYYEVRITNVTTGQIDLLTRTRHPAVQTDVTLRSAQYRTQVRACQAACGALSAPVDFNVTLGAVPTSAPSITSAVVNGGNSLSMSWTAVPGGTEWYQVQVVQPRPAGPGGGALTVAARQVFGATNVTLPVPAGQASVFVAACNGDGCGPNSVAASITPAGPNPAAPQMGSPLDGSVPTGPAVLFAWTRIPTGNLNTIYRLYVQDQSRQRAALDVYTTQNFYSALLKADGGRYAALVIANPGLPDQVAGPPITFTVRGSSAVAPTMMAPTHASVVPAGNVLLGWTPVPGASLYEYLVSVQGQAAASGRGVTPGIFVMVPLVAVGGQPTIYNGIVRACPAGQTCSSGSDVGWGPWSSAAGSGVVSFTVTP
jgi:hypothetical protein